MPKRKYLIPEMDKRRFREELINNFPELVSTTERELYIDLLAGCQTYYSLVRILRLLKTGTFYI